MNKIASLQELKSLNEEIEVSDFLFKKRCDAIDDRGFFRMLFPKPGQDHEIISRQLEEAKKVRSTLPQTVEISAGLASFLYDNNPLKEISDPKREKITETTLSSYKLSSDDGRYYLKKGNYESYTGRAEVGGRSGGISYLSIRMDSSSVGVEKNLGLSFIITNPNNAAVTPTNNISETQHVAKQPTVERGKESPER